MAKSESVFAIGDEVVWLARLPWYKEEGPFIVTMIFDNDLAYRVCGQNRLQEAALACNNLSPQCVNIMVKDNKWVIRDQYTGQPAKIASRFFRKVT